MNLSDDLVRLRALEPEDVVLLYKWENDTDLWRVSNALVPYSKYILTKYIETSSLDIYQSRQLRLIIESISSGEAVGAIDLFDFEPFHMRAGVGILIYAEKDRRMGYAKSTLNVLSEYAFSALGLHQIYANIPADNIASRELFKSLGYTEAGIKKEWLKEIFKSGETTWIDELTVQLIRK